MEADGFSLDDKRTFIDGKGDIPDIVKKFKTKADGTNCFSIDFKTIKDNDYNLSVQRYREVVHEEKEYDKPKDMIDRVTKEEEEILKELKELKARL